MSLFEILAILGSLCSILSLLVAIFIAKKVISISVQGDKNTIIGRDGRVGRE